MQHRRTILRTSALVLVLALVAGLTPVAPAAALGAPTSTGDPAPGPVQGFLAGLWSGFVDLLASPIQGTPGMERDASPSTSTDSSTEEEDDCDTDDSCGFDRGGIGGIMDPNG